MVSKALLRKHSQIALEFLTTYGWAILLMTVMVGVLAYYGVINPEKMVKPRCVTGSDFICRDHQILQDGTVRLRLKVNIPEGIRYLKVDGVYDDGSSGSVDRTFSSIQYSFLEVVCRPDDPTNFEVGDLKKVKLTLTYKIGGGVYDHIQEGEVVDQVVEGTCSNSDICTPSETCTC